MIFRDALRSLRDDFTRSFFYWLTLLLTTMFIYLFFHIMNSDPVGVGFLEGGTDPIATGITITVVIICMMAILFANDFFIKNKAKEIAVRLVCGATAYQLALYLLIQTTILLLIALPLGIFLAQLLIPFLNSVLSTYMQSEFIIGIHPKGNLLTTIILGMVIFWILMLNLSFALSTGAALMLNRSSMTRSSGSSLFYNAAISGKLKGALWLVLFLAPVVLFYINPNYIIVMSLLSFVGFVKCVDQVFVPWISRRLKRFDKQPEKMVYEGFVRVDLQLMKNNILLFMICAVLLTTALIVKQTPAIELMLYLLSYIVMNVLLSLAIMFKYSTELSVRSLYFRSLNNIGYTEKQLRSIAGNEVTMFYLIILALAMLYLGNIFISQIIAGKLTVTFALVLTGLFVLPLFVCYIVNRVYYNRLIVITREK